MTNKVSDYFVIITEKSRGEIENKKSKISFGGKFLFS